MAENVPELLKDANPKIKPKNPKRVNKNLQLAIS